MCSALALHGDAACVPWCMHAHELLRRHRRTQSPRAPSTSARHERLEKLLSMKVRGRICLQTHCCAGGRNHRANADSRRRRCLQGSLGRSARAQPGPEDRMAA